MHHPHARKRVRESATTLSTIAQLSYPRPAQLSLPADPLLEPLACLLTRCDRIPPRVDTQDLSMAHLDAKQQCLGHPVTCYRSFFVALPSWKVSVEPMASYDGGKLVATPPSVVIESGSCQL